MSAPRFSIIIPAHNVADYIAACLDSVIKQDFADWEVIVINDGSTDATGKVLASYVHDPRIKIRRQPNSGLSATRNSGVRKATGAYLLFLDADDFLTSSALSTIDRELQSGDDPDLLRFQAQDFYEDGTVCPHPELGFPATTGLQAFKTLAAYHYTENAWAYAYRTDFFKTNKFKYAEGCIAEDFGLTPLIIARATTIKSIPAICYNYRQRAGSIMRTPQKLKTRVVDSFIQLQDLLPALASIEGTQSITHYLVASFLTLAAQLSPDQFTTYYEKSKQSGFLRYLHPSTPKSFPRAILAKFAPRQFYRHYHQTAAPASLAEVPQNV